MATSWNQSPWDTSYQYTDPRYSAYRGGGGAGISAAGTVPYGNVATQTNRLMTGEAKAPFVANLPDYESMVKQRTGNIGAELKGEVPQDVITQILQQAAERGIATGSPGSPNANAAMLRSLGLTSLGMQQQGGKDLSAAIADTPVPQLFNPASLFVPEHMAGLELGAAGAGLRAGGGGYPGTVSGAGPGFSPTPQNFPTYPNLPAVGATGPFAEAAPNWAQTYGQYSGSPGATGAGAPYQTADFNPAWYANTEGQTDYGALFQDPNLPAGWNEQYGVNSWMEDLFSDLP